MTVYKPERLTPLLLGKAPPHWESAFIDELTDMLTNGFVGPSLSHQTDDTRGILYLQGFNVRPNKIRLDKVTKVKEEFHLKNKKSSLKEGDLLVVQSGHIGTAAVVPPEVAGANCHALIIVRFKRGKVNPYFVSQYINSHIGQARLRGLEVGSSLPHINTSELGRFRIPVPPLKEQDELVSILATWDDAIDKTAQLIAAKEQHYTHELSRLISQAQRTLCHISDFASEVSERNRDGACERVLSVTNDRGFVLPEHQFGRRVASEDVSNYKVVRKGQYAYNPSRINVGSIARLDDYDIGVLSPMYVVFALDETNVNSDFFRHWLDSHEARERIKRSAQGSVRETVSFSEFATIRFPLPLLEQQQKIANYLNTLHEEIALLAAYAGKLKEQKRGLMQKLLTGQWRVNAPKEVCA